MALFRCLGATRRTVFGLILSEAAFISTVGAIAGVVLAHGIVAVGSHLIKVETGLRFSAGYISQADCFVLPAALLLGLVAGLLPAIQAYRLGVLSNLTPVS